MQQLDKWQKELEHLTQKSYKQTDSELFNIYRQSLIDIKKKLYNYTQAYPNLSFSSRLEVERLFHVADEMDAILSASYGSVEETIKNYSAGQANQGYYGAWYALEQSQNIIMQMPLINHEYVMNLVNAPVAGKRLSKRLYEYRDELAQNVTNNIINGLFEGKSYAEIAKRVSNETEASYKNALRIVITEGGRTQSTTNQKSSENAKALGIDMQKRWLSTLDGKTRHDHRTLDGQTVDIEDDFEIHGYRAQGPRLFGVAKEDIRCRCTTINIVDGVGPEFRNDNDSKELIKYKDYNDWLEGVVAEKEKESSNGQYGADMDYIRSESYQNKIKNDPHLNHIYKSIANSSRRMIQHRNGTPFEDYYLLNYKTGKAVAISNKTRVKKGVRYNDSVKSAFASGKKDSYISIHNHPSGFPPSLSDIAALRSKSKNDSVYMGLTAGHDGSLYWYTKPKKRFTRNSIKIYDARVEKYVNLGYNEVKAQEIALSQFTELYGFEFGKVEE